MARSPVLFFAALFIGLTAGRAFWVCLGENPFNMSGATYVEFFQQLDRGIARPIAMTGVGGTLLAGIAAFLHRRERRVFRLLLVACGLGAVACVVTILVNVPINRELAHWDPAALPAGYDIQLHRWWQWHWVRFVAMFSATCLIYGAMLLRGAPSSRA
jgi:uncharacterized membrane protein